MHPGVEFHAVRGVVALVLDENKITNGVNRRPSSDRSCAQTL